MQKFVLLSGIYTAMLGVGIGAFGTHGLKDFLTTHNRVDTFETAVRYQIYHALALLLIGLLMSQ